MILFRKYFELLFWIVSLTALAMMQPTSDTHFSLCIFKLLGIDFCPGCGLGHSISFLFHGNMSKSFSLHPLGIFAVLVILFRVYKLLLLRLFSKKLKINYATQWRF
ncbi:MAG: DUF2752 domain-containing protein [Bacteroidota bacterium]|nr:DUF2752 domain-containing protein [Bacteroidota bacterium]